MTLPRVVSRSLRYYWRTNLFIVFGVMIATAVMTGSLLVGDSMTESLRQNVLSKLGRIDHVLLTPHFFPDTLAARLAESPELIGKVNCATLLLTRGVARPVESEQQRANVSVLGIDENFWALFPGDPTKPLQAGNAAVSQSLAGDLHLKPGDEIILRIDRSGTLTDDILFANRRREETQTSLRLLVAAIVPDGSGGDFALDAGALGATAPRNVFLPRASLAAALKRPATANAILLHADQATAQNIRTALATHARLADYGLTMVPSDEGHYLALESSSLLLTDDQIASAQQAAGDVAATALQASVYLASRIEKSSPDHKEISYAILSAIPAGALWNMKQGTDQNLPPNAAILNDWAAADLDAKPGDLLDLTYLVPTPAGAYVENKLALQVAAIVELSGPAADRHLTPALNGLTDAQRIDEWKLPFPVDHSRLTDRDEAYWDRYGPTPKIFAPPAVLQEIWKKTLPAGAAGWVTAMHLVPPPDIDLAQFERAITAPLLHHLSPEQNQMAFRPVREQLLASASGSTDFGQLFLAVSFFLIVAAAAMAGMLMRLLVEQRAAEIGSLFSCGWRRRKVTLLLLIESLTLTLLGVLLGLPAGVLYNRAVLGALARWWMTPWGDPILQPHLTPTTLAIGGISGLFIGVLCALWGVGALSKSTPLQLLSGRHSLCLPTPALKKNRGRFALPIAIAALAAAMLIAPGFHLIPAQAGFFLGGAATLAALLMATSAAFTQLLRNPHTINSPLRLAIRNAAANRRRSLLTIGLLAAASFILVAVAANRRDYSRLDTTDKRSSAGGFVLRATTATPLHYDLGSPSGRARLGVSPAEEKILSTAQIFPLTESPGDDVSCLNLAKPLQPRLLGITPALVQRGGFPLEVAPALNAPTLEFLVDHAPWSLLLQPPDAQGAIPAFGDADSLQWILHTSLGETYTFPGPDGAPIKLKIVGIIPGSIFAGELLISEQNLRQLYPQMSGSTYFLIAPQSAAAAPWNESAVTDALRNTLADQGVEVRTTREILTRFISVQNVYLSIFLSLGGLGLILGTAGLVAVIARSVLERRRELALMAAAGFRRWAIIRLVALEHLGLLAGGLLCGTASALLAVTPVLTSGRAQVQWTSLAATLALAALIGLVACIITARCSIGAHPVAALRQQ